MDPLDSQRPRRPAASRQPQQRPRQAPQGSGQAPQGSGQAPSRQRPAAPRTPSDEAGTPAEGTRTERRKQREAERRQVRRKRAIRGVGGIVSAMLILILALGGWAWWQFRGIDRVDVDLVSVADGEPFNFLLVGSDTRDLDVAGADAGVIWGDETTSGKRADTIVIARIDPKIASVELLSIPRDLWVAEPGKSEAEHRINATYADGPQMLIDVIEENLEIPINHYAEVDFNGFKDIVDGVGGVPLYFEYPVYDQQTGLDVKTPGCMLADGVDALAFARSRDLYYSNGVNWVPDPTGDLGRITRQQIFMRRLLETVSALGLGDLNTVRVVAAKGASSVTLDETLSVSQIVELGRRFSSFDPTGMDVHSLPTEPYRTSGGAAVQLLDEDAAQLVLPTFTGEKPLVAPTTTAFTPDLVTLDVLNGTSIGGLAGSTSELLGEAGFLIDDVGDAEPVSTTEIRYGDGGEQGAALVGESLDGTFDLVADSTLQDGEIQLVLADEVSLRGADGPDGGETSTTAENPDGSTTTGTDGSDSEALGSGEGDAPAEPTVGVALGDPPAGVACNG